MNDLAPNTPVIVGVGFQQERDDDPIRCAEAYQLMVRAVRNAAEDAGSEALLHQIESISVPQGMWQYRNPGKLVADALGCPAAKSIISDLGVLQLTLLSDLCRAIAAGEQDVGVVTGGEAQFRALRGMITGQPATDTEQPEDTPPPDVHHTSPDPFCSDLEGQRGIQMPVQFFAIIESALRYRQGLGIEEHRDEVARLYSSFSEIAAANPHAWRRAPMSAEEIRNPTAKNPMLAFPYTKRHCSQWNVNHGVAILVCSAAKAEELGLAREGWIFPVAATQSRHVVVPARKRRLHSHPGTVACGERALALAGVAGDDIMAAELYSCFPSAIRCFARDLNLKEGCPLTVTGSMAFGGGPFNHFSLEGVARMVEVLRAAARRRIGETRRPGLQPQRHLRQASLRTAVEPAQRRRLRLRGRHGGRRRRGRAPAARRRLCRSGDDRWLYRGLQWRAALARHRLLRHAQRRAHRGEDRRRGVAGVDDAGGVLRAGDRDSEWRAFPLATSR